MVDLRNTAEVTAAACTDAIATVFTKEKRYLERFIDANLSLEEPEKKLASDSTLESLRLNKMETPDDSEVKSWQEF